MSESGRRFNRLDAYEKMDDHARSRALGPSIVVDLCLGVVFFFVARQFGLVTAALTGAVITSALFVVQRFIKTDLLGGFAVFGVVMALISAGLALAFQDDTFIKLRGSLMGGITASAALTDALMGGRYLGRRIKLYMGGAIPMTRKRGAYAMAAAGFAMMAIELPLVFLLTTDQWIWYQSFFDSLVAIPVVLLAFWIARDPNGGVEDEPAKVNAEAE